MAGTLNKVFLIGRLGKDPELRHTQSGKAVANFSIATDEGSKENPRTEWHRIVAWDRTAEIVDQYLRKGSRCHVEGKLQTHEWEKDGVKRQSTEIVAWSVILLDGKTEWTKGEKPASPATPPAGDAPNGGEQTNWDPPADDYPL